MIGWLEHLANAPIRDLKWYDVIAGCLICFAIIGVLLFLAHLLGRAIAKRWG